MDGDKRVEQAKARISDVLTSDLDALRAEVARLTEQLSSFIDEEKSTLSKLFSKEAKSAKQILDSKLSDVSSKAGEITDAAKEQATDLQKATLDYISKKPLQSVAIAAGIGLLLGLWSKNRS
jgi:ElaB/YqjD/DUF883 family membrane-anchored ribosome-binding protein